MAEEAFSPQCSGETKGKRKGKVLNISLSRSCLQKLNFFFFHSQVGTTPLMCEPLEDT